MPKEPVGFKIEENYRSLFANMVNGSAMHTLVYDSLGVPEDYTIIEVNPAFEALLGISREKVINKTSREAYSVDVPPYLEIYARVALTGKNEVFETYYAPVDKHLSITVYCLQTGSFATIFENITDRKQKEKVLLESEVKYRTLVDNSLVGFVQTKLDGEVTYVNDAFVKMYEATSAKEFIGIRMTGVYKYANDRDKVIGLLKKDGRVDNFEVVGLTVKGNERTRLLSANISGEVINGLAFDITERKHAEDALKKSEMMLREAGALAKVGGWELDLATSDLTWSEETYRLHEVDPHIKPRLEDGIGFYAPEGRPVLTEAINRAITQGIPFDVELPFITAKGNPLWVRSIGNVDMADGHATRLYGVFQDITERMQFEKYKSIAPEVLKILNQPGNLHDTMQLVLAALKTQTGFDAVGIRLQDGDDFPFFAQDGFSEDFLLTQNSLNDCARDGAENGGKDGKANNECTCRLVCSGKTDPASPCITQGGSFWSNEGAGSPFLDTKIHPLDCCFHHGYASIALVPIRNADRIVGLIQLNDHRKGQLTLSTVEILEGIAAHLGSALIRKQAEQALKNSEAELRELNATKDKFFSIIAHDLKSPFNGFLGLTDILAHELGTLSLTELQNISIGLNKSATNLFSLLNNLLEWACMQQGITLFEPNQIVLEPFVASIIQSALDLINRKGIKVNIVIPEKLEVVADENMLASTIRNLVSNAVKFTPSGGFINISAKLTADGYIEIVVKDSGIGMDAVLLANLYKLDLRIRRKGTEGEPSTGLGLLLCKGFIEKQGGIIWAESEEGIGSTFHFTLPGNAEQLMMAINQ
jgi:PAS domain S-box-containing protein